MKSIYLLLTQTNTTLASAIRFYTKGSYSHVSMSLDENLEELYSFSRKYTRNPFIGTFMNEDIEGGVYALKPMTQSMVLRIDVTDQQYSNVECILTDFKENRAKYGYSVLGLIYFMLEIPRQNDYKFTCAQFVTFVLEEAKVTSFDTHYSFRRPDDFIERYKDHVIYEGLLKDYRREKFKQTSKQNLLLSV